MTNRIKFYPQALLATLALRGYSVKAFVADNPVVCEKTIYRALKSGEISTRTLYRVCSALQISPVSLLVGPEESNQSNWDIGEDVSECTRCKSLFVTKYLLAIGRCEPPLYCPMCGAYMVKC